MTVKELIEAYAGHAIEDVDVIHVLVDLRRKRKKQRLNERQKVLVEKIVALKGDL